MTIPPKSKKTSFGGSAAGGGLLYQARVTAIAAVHLARGSHLRWLDGLAADVPVSVAAESGGPGDDIQIRLHSGAILEAQVKRGLRAGARLWEPLIGLGHGVQNRRINYGVLVVSPDSSGAIQHELAIDITRIGDGRIDGIRALGRSLLAKFKNAGLDPIAVCRLLRITTVHALDSDNVSIAAAHAELAHLCRDQAQIDTAWKYLCDDALSLIERRGQRDISAVLRVLKEGAIILRIEERNPASFVARLCAWIARANEEFSVFGIEKPLPLDTAWIPLSLVAQSVERKRPVGLEEALLQYHDWHERGYGASAAHIAPQSLTRFYPHCVVIAGPGMGKSTYIRKLARTFAAEDVPVLKVSARLVASRMQQGSSFEEALFAHALDGSGLSKTDAEDSKVQHWLVLCDGLDECGPYQEMLVQGLLAFLASRPRCRALVTTRPIGYSTTLLRSWPHYEVLPLETEKYPEHFRQMLSGIMPNDTGCTEETLAFTSAEIKKSKAVEIVTRNPLLVALALSLSLRRIAFGRSKSQLYEKIFEIIDSIPNLRKSQDAPTQPVLMRFVDILGWDIVFHPVSLMAERLKRCAAVVGNDLSLTPFQALAQCQRCSEYWQDVGMLERVQHAGEETLTFVHKTFGEFAAARYLVSLSPPQFSAETASALDSELANEVIGFAGSLGIADVVCAALLKHSNAPSRAARNVPRALALVVEEKNPPDDILRKAVIALAAALLASPDADTSDAVGVALLDVAARYPDDVAAHLQQLAQHEQRWTRLAAWAGLLACGERYYDFDQMREAFQTIPRRGRRTLTPSLGGYVTLDRSSYKLMQAFALSAMTVVLTRSDSLEADKFLKDVFQNDSLQSWDTIRKADAILKKFGREFSLMNIPKEAVRNWPNFQFDGKSFFEMNDTAFTRMFQPLGSGSPKGTPERAPLYELSAFMAQTGVWDMGASDIWAWRDTSMRDEEAVVIRAAGAVSGLNTEVLAADVDAFIAYIAVNRDEKRSSIFDQTVHVDVPPINWTKAALLNIDLATVERALHHRSDWLVRQAANLMLAVAPEDKLPNIVRRLLTNGTGTTLWAAANLAHAIGGSVGRELLYERLNQRINAGCEHLFHALRENEVRLDDNLVRAASKGLLGPNAEVAVAAARLVLSLVDPSTILPVLEDAYAHWKKYEKPYPENGGVIPPSPRSEIVQALVQIRPLSDVELFEMSSDTRVRDVVAPVMRDRLSDDEGFAKELIRKVSDLEISTRPLIDALRAKKPLQKQQVESIRALLGHPNAKVRFSALGILDETYLGDEEIRALASALRDDAEAEIRERALRIVHRQEGIALDRSGWSDIGGSFSC
jgi:hypothetical protein